MVGRTGLHCKLERGNEAVRLGTTKMLKPLIIASTIAGGMKSSCMRELQTTLECAVGTEDKWPLLAPKAKIHFKSEPTEYATEMIDYKRKVRK